MTPQDLYKAVLKIHAAIGVDQTDPLFAAVRAASAMKQKKLDRARIWYAEFVKRSQWTHHPALCQYYAYQDDQKLLASNFK